MHGDAALDEEVRNAAFPNSRLKGEANLLIMPTLDAANIAFNLLKAAAGGGVTLGPMLLGVAKPVHILTPSATVRRIVNMTALTVVDCHDAQGSPSRLNAREVRSRPLARDSLSSLRSRSRALVGHRAPPVRRRHCPAVHHPCTSGRFSDAFASLSNRAAVPLSPRSSRSPPRPAGLGAGHEDPVPARLALRGPGGALSAAEGQRLFRSRKSSTSRSTPATDPAMPSTASRRAPTRWASPTSPR